MAFSLPLLLWFAMPIDVVDGGVDRQPQPLKTVIPLGELVAPPHGFVQMCREHPDSCKPAYNAPSAEVTDKAQPIAVPSGALGKDAGKRLVHKAAQPRKWNKLLRSVNGYVNRNVAQVSDRSRFGVDERWVASGVGADGAGDCEDIAIEKRQLLLAAGFPADRLRYAVVYSQRSGLHTVLVADVAAKAFVLDSRSGGVRLWSRTPYRWLALQENGSQWRRVTS